MSRNRVPSGALVVLCLALLAVAGDRALAQQGPGGAIDPHRDCQTILNCQFKPGGSFRGCVSSYSCRICRFVEARCTIGGAPRQHCQQLRCSWG